VTVASSTIVAPGWIGARHKTGARRIRRSRASVAAVAIGAPAPNGAAACGARSLPAEAFPTGAPGEGRRRRSGSPLTARGGAPKIALVPYLKLIQAATQHVTEIREAVARLGRSPECAVVLAGDASGVVSGMHAELRYTDREWRLSDLGSRNGTFLNGRRLAAPSVVQAGDVISLGETGPRLTVAAVSEAVATTIPEHPGIDQGEESPPLAEPPQPPQPAQPPPPEVRAYGVTLLDAATGRRYEARGVRIRLGRGRECEVRPVGRSDTIVSRVHAELTVGPSGALVLRDAGSRNGTFLNGERVTAPVPVRLGDRIALGPGGGGPVLIVEGLGTAPLLPLARLPQGGLGRRTAESLINRALAGAQRGRRRTALLLLGLLAAGVYVVYWRLSTQVEQTEQAQQTAEDSARAATERLRSELSAARAAAAPATRVDSLRAQLESAQARTTELRAALDRAQAAVAAQIAAGEARRVASQAEVQRLRDELAAAEQRAPSAATLDSLRGAVALAERQTQSFDAKLRAIRATDFVAIAQQNQAAVGLVTVAIGREHYSGTGFVIAPDGYMLTNWHVVADSLHPRADTIWVTMADQSQAHYADVIATSQEHDIAVIKIRGYQGSYIPAVDWSGTKARQGEPAALIGFPAGAGFAHLRSSTVRTSMTAGIISRATEDVIQFDGMTIGGSSGSPLFNANGEVIAIHRAALPQAPGFALSVPARHAVPILPTALRQKLGLPEPKP
jgi:pSer/pThr/pTyr-binding forkhead associated (FHA) protein